MHNMTEKTLKNILLIVSFLFVCVLVLQGLYMSGALPGRNTCDPDVVCAALPQADTEQTEKQTDSEVEQQAAVSDASCAKPDYRYTEEVPGILSHEGYTLEKMVVLSRHNIRSPLSGPDSLLGSITPHTWFQWSSAPSELSLRGGVLETNVGNFFRKWLESEGLIPANYHPEPSEVRIYANSKQRTIATAQYFLAGFLPTAGLDVEYHVEFDKMDPVFNPQLTFVSDSYRTDAQAQINELFSEKINSLSDNYEFLSDVIDIKDSPAWKDGTVTALSTDDSEYIFEVNAEPGLKGSLKTATSVSDAMVLQYFEEADPVAAAFGNSLTEDQWSEIAEIKDVYNDVLFTAPLISANLANPLLKEIASEMDDENRIFTFLCGHDSNVASVLSALGAEDYSLPNTIEKETPIGVKVVFSKLVNSEGEAFWGIDLVYLTTSQLRNMPLLNLENHPAIVPVVLKDAEANADGLYPEQVLRDRFAQAIDQYEVITEKYAEK